MKNVVYATPRFPCDETFHDLMVEWSTIIPDSSEIYYVWANPLEKLEGILRGIKFDSDDIFLFIPDNLTDFNFIPHRDSTSYGVKIIMDILGSYPEKAFTLITQVNNIEKEIKLPPNLKRIVDTDMLACIERAQYLPIPPVLTKNFHSETHFLMLNNRASLGRVSAISYLFGTNISENGYITLGRDFNRLSNFDDYMSFIPWAFNEKHGPLKEILEVGYKQLLNSNFSSIGSEVHKAKNHSVNFDTQLRPLYENSFVEIIGETYFEEPSCMLTEKTLHNILGCSFPILLCSAGAVERLRFIGVDTFDDIVDHSYDSVTNHIDRLVYAIELNKKLLTDPEYAKQQWIQCKHRFVHNIEFIKNKMYSKMHDVALCELKKTLY